MKPKIVIECDDREPEMQLLVDINDIKIEFDRKRLLVGDYIYKDLIVERKTIDDFCSSILDKRLEGQIEKMKESGKNCFIFVIGQVKDRTVAIHENCVLGKIMSILFKHGIKVMWCETEEEFLWCLNNLCEKYDKMLEEKK